jgi:hypothetical protein
VGSFDAGSLLLGRTKLSAPVLDDGFSGNSEGTCHIIQVEDICFGSVESAFLLKDHLGHEVPKERIRRIGV